MKNAIYIFVIFALIIISALVIKSNLSLKEDIRLIENQAMGKTDTVYVDKPPKILTEYKIVQVPKLITYYQVDTVVVDSIKVQRDTIRIYSEDITFDYNVKFLSTFPEAEKLVQMELTNKKLNFSLVKTDGNVITKKFDINTERNNYLYTNNRLTTKRKPIKFVFETELLARPFTNMYDLNVVIGFKTGKFSYVGGLSTYYYPNLQTSVGFTPIIGLKFTL